MLKRSERLSSSSSAERPTPKQNKQKSKEMEGNQETVSLISMEILLDKLVAYGRQFLQSTLTDLWTYKWTQTWNQCHQINPEWTREICEPCMGKHWGPTARVQSPQRLKKITPKNDGQSCKQTVEIQGLKAIDNNIFDISNIPVEYQVQYRLKIFTHLPRFCRGRFAD